MSDNVRKAQKQKYSSLEWISFFIYSATKENINTRVASLCDLESFLRFPAQNQHTAATNWSPINSDIQT